MTTPHEAEIESFEVQHDAAEYWTPEQMEAAEPFPMPSLPDDLERTPPDEGSTASKSPAECVARAESDMSRPPNSAIGKLFFDSNGKHYACSATAVGPHKVLTAAHCLVVPETGAEATNIMFYPGYPRADKLKYPGVNVVYWNPWKSTGKTTWDYAMFSVAQDMAPTIGNVGSLWDATTWWRDWIASGYPEEPRAFYSGKQFFQATGSQYATYIDNIVEMNKNGMGQGSSGGPWLTTNTDNISSKIDGSGNSGWYVNSVQAAGEGCLAIGPYFDANYKQMYDTVKQ